MPTVGEFYDDLRAVVARGNSLDAQLAIRTRQALRLLERNYTFDYMRDTYVLIPDPGVLFFDTELVGLKKVDLAYYGADGGRIPLRKISRDSIGAFETGAPGNFWLEQGKIFFTGILADAAGPAYPLLMPVEQYSVWPTDPDASHPMLDLADDLLKYQVLLSNTSSLRSLSEIQGWKLMRDEALHSAIAAQDENDRPTSAVMNYYGGISQLYTPASAAIAVIRGLYDLPETFEIAGLYHIGP